jgi:tetratricopeptide (TPR) repeat protein
MRLSKIIPCTLFVCLAAFVCSPPRLFGQSVLAEAYLDAADAAREASNIEKAARLYALGLTEAHNQQHPMLTARALLGAASVHIERGELDQAEENVRAALTLCDAQPTVPPELLTTGLNSMAMISYHRHNYEQAEACYVKLLKDLQSSDESLIVRGIVLNDLALVEISLGHPEEGQEPATEAADIMFAKFGSTSAPYAQCLDTLAQIYHADNQLEVAERLSRASLKICAADIGTDNPQYGSALLTLGKIQHRQGQHREGLLSAAHAVEIQERHLGSPHPLVIRAKDSHAAIVEAGPSSKAIQPPNDDENRMFDEMYGHAGIEPDELAALRDHWRGVSGAERLQQYVDFHSERAALSAQDPSTPKAEAAAPKASRQAAAAMAPADDESIFQSLLGRHSVSPEELKKLREHWYSLSSEQRQAAAKMFLKSLDSPTTSASDK